MGLSGQTPEATSLLTAMLALVDTLVDDVDIVERPHCSPTAACPCLRWTRPD
jgi:hypothetical protein